jgi:hypothetical protein
MASDAYDLGPCGGEQPAPRTALDGLFPAGCAAGNACMGTQQAASSGMCGAHRLRAALRAGGLRS